MAISIIMPKMGESITEGTILEWKKKIGDKIEKDETILEISTDKVDSEVPSPAEGVLLEIKAKPNDTVDVGAVIGYIGEENEALSDSNDQDNKTKAKEKIKNDVEDNDLRMEDIEQSIPQDQGGFMPRREIE